MKFKRLFTTFMALAMVGTMAGCTKTQTEEVKETKKLRFGYNRQKY